MPDQFGFNHEPHFGTVYHRCIECDEYAWGVHVPARERERHYRKHWNKRQHALERERLNNLRLARKAKRQYERESG